MEALVVYDSVFGNTEQIARAIGDELAKTHDVSVVRVGDVAKDSLAGVGALVVGSPTRAFRATRAIRKFLTRIPRGSLENVRVAGFDTRICEKDANSRIFSFFVRWFGYAAEPTAAALVKKGGDASGVEPAGFIVKDSEGPLKEGELERAAVWAAQIAREA